MKDLVEQRAFPNLIPRKKNSGEEHGLRKGNQGVIVHRRKGGDTQEE